MDTRNDPRTVLTLDAGGTNFVFSAVRANRTISEPVILPSNGHDLDLCLDTILKGFGQIKTGLDSEPVAISFAFPGPSDYANGIIGDLGNLPAFRGGIALGPMLEHHFNLPVFINNDGDLFVYGEAISGLLPWTNELLKAAGSHKQFNNLMGVTLGTGFGGGLVRKGELVLGDNGASGEVWLLRSLHEKECFAEESISIRAVVRNFRSRSTVPVPENITPLDIYEIARGKKEGDREAAMSSFSLFGEALGDALANMITMFDGLVVVGGGLSRAWELFAPAMISHLNGSIMTVDGKAFPRTEVKAFNLEDAAQLDQFLQGNEKKVPVPFTSRTAIYDPMKRTGVGLSRLGTSEAVSTGAYAFALNAIDSGTLHP
jgi:glucokinase